MNKLLLLLTIPVLVGVSPITKLPMTDEQRIQLSKLIGSKGLWVYKVYLPSLTFEITEKGKYEDIKILTPHPKAVDLSIENLDKHMVELAHRRIESLTFLLKKTKPNPKMGKSDG